MTTPEPPSDSLTPAREQRLLEGALALGTEAQRQAFLALLDDADLRCRLEELLAASAEADSFFGKDARVHAGMEPSDHPTQVLASSKPPAEAPAQVIGRYKLLEKVGEGGFGEVWMAEQREPVKRRVALKIIKLGMDSRQVVARFEAERQALAMMDHPNIARIFDGDVTDSGRPYFVMELVRGIRITDYCDQHQLTTRDRLDLFIKVCQAIQHAHQKGIIHRDIKPSNILVTLHDGVPVPKVIDFGIAKATQQELTDVTLFTQFQQFIGTPAYISPEQAEMSGLDIDTRADIYSLGVLLYELLVGQTPFDAREMMKGGLDALRQIIREREPQRPSTRLNTLQGDERTTAGKRRQTEVSKLVHQLHGDLDWIVMKCLEKDRTRRYETANGLAADIQRHLANEPVIARPPSTAYRIQKAWQRNKLAFSAAAAVAVALVAGIGVSTWQAIRARQAEEAKAGLLAAANEAKANEESQRRLAEGNATEAKAAVTRLEIDRAEALFREDKTSEALAYLARVVRREPANRVAGERILSALAHRNFGVPLFRLELKGGGTAAEFSPDGQRILTVSTDDGAQIRDGRTGQVLLGPLPHDGEVTAAHFSPDGTRVVTVSEDKSVRIWDAQTGQPVTAPLQHESVVRSADFSPDGERLVTGSDDGSMRQWNAATGAPAGTNMTLEGCVDFVKFSPDSQWIVVVSSSPGSSKIKTCRLVKVADGTVIIVFEKAVAEGTLPSFSRDGTRLVGSPQQGFLEILGPGFGSMNRIREKLYDIYGVLAARFSPDGQYVVAASEYESLATLRDATTLKPVVEKMRHAHWVTAIEFSPDGQRIATGSKDHTVRIWDARTGRPLSEPLRHDANMVSVQFSADGQRVLSVCEGGGLWVWEIRCAQPMAAVLQHQYPIRKAVFSPVVEQASTVTDAPSQTECLVRLWDVPRATLLLPPLAVGNREIQFSRDGRLLLGLKRGSGTITILDSRSGEVVGRPFATASIANYARFSPDGQLVVTGGPGEGDTDSKDNSVRVWRVADGVPVAKFSHEDGAGFARFSPDGRWVVTTSLDKTARIWDWQTGKELTEPLRHDGAVVWVDVSADSTRVLTLSRDQTARIWEAGSGRLLHKLPHGGEPYHFNSAEFSPDGRRVVISSGTVAQVFDAHTGQPVTAALTHSGRVNSVKFSPDGQRLITTCYDSTAHLWDTATGHPVSEPLKHADRVNYAEFSPDGRRVITASRDGTARIFEVPMLPSSVPPVLADWAEAVAGQRLDERNASQPVSFAELHRLRQSLALASEGDETTRWARWFFAENAATRRISPNATLTVPQLVQQRIQDNTLESLQQAVWLSPANGLAQAHLAFLTLTNTATPDPRLLAALDWQSRHGVELSPKDPNAWLARSKFLNHLEKSAEATEAMDRVNSLNPTNATFWNERGLMLEKANRLEEAVQSYTKAIELSGPWTNSRTLPGLAYRNRRRINLQLNHLAEAAADFAKAYNLPPRDPGAPATLIDLSLSYNSCFEGNMPPLGRQTLEGRIEFDIRGLIWLAADSTSRTSPGEAPGLPIAQKGRRLHFLHTALNQKLSDGTEIGVYRVHYSDGQQKDIPILYGAHVRTYPDLVDPKDPKGALAGNTTLAWSVEASPGWFPVQLFAMTWENERPDVAIESLDVISRKTGTAPMLFAITVEP